MSAFTLTVKTFHAKNIHGYLELCWRESTASGADAALCL